MPEIDMESLTRQHGNEYHYIDAFDDERTVRVWGRKWMPRFMSADHSASETKILYVRARKLDDATIRSIKAKIECEQEALEPKALHADECFKKLSGG
jgi:hypothetical protein